MHPSAGYRSGKKAGARQPLHSRSGNDNTENISEMWRGSAKDSGRADPARWHPKYDPSPDQRSMKPAGSSGAVETSSMMLDAFELSMMPR